jgi:hypothetical protein
MLVISVALESLAVPLTGTFLDKMVVVTVDRKKGLASWRSCT